MTKEFPQMQNQVLADIFSQRVPLTNFAPCVAHLAEERRHLENYRNCGIQSYGHQPTTCHLDAAGTPLAANANTWLSVRNGGALLTLLSWPQALVRRLRSPG